MSIHNIKPHAQRLRINASFKVSFGPSKSTGQKFDRTKGVLTRGAYRYHKGSKAKADAGGKLKAHIKYIEGSEKQKEKDRKLFDDSGREQTADQAIEQHRDVFTEHRVIISPAGGQQENNREDMHLLSQAAIQKSREANPKAEIEASYAVHLDTDNPHSHILLTSPNKVKLDKEFYKELRQELMDIKTELKHERSQGRHHSHTIDQALGHDQKPELELSR